MSSIFKLFTQNSSRNKYHNNLISKNIIIDSRSIKDEVKVLRTSPNKLNNLKMGPIKFPIIKRNISQNTKNTITKEINKTFLFTPFIKCKVLKDESDKNIFISRIKKSRNKQNEFKYLNKELSSILLKHNNYFKINNYNNKNLYDLKELINNDENIKKDDFIHKIKTIGSESNNIKKKKNLYNEYLLNNRRKKIIMDEINNKKINKSYNYRIKNNKMENCYLKYQEKKCNKSINQVSLALKNLRYEINDSFKYYIKETENEFNNALNDYISSK